MTESDFVSLEAAATVLGISVRHVRRLVNSGSLTQVARGVLERDSVDRYLMSQRQGRTRSWAEHTAWGAIAVLSGGEADWLGPTQISRVRRTLRELADPSELVSRVRDRARVRTFTAHRAALPRLRATVLRPNMNALGIVDSGADRIDGYIAARELDNVIRTLGLRTEPSGDITLRVTGFDFDQVGKLVSTSAVVAALDAATALDPRIRGVGQRALTEMLETYR
ncbi:type IV toxin-antitoxin system AbiEi family antitoxin domain-containing protein [Nocardia sp. NPDC050630]|uniref:type IV toxin-antitoxin system AbiEi family antitoxin domain-containing protein n=1 Tax=Nocardia sp. NPDC050630 TaxID=3364321 RepID=UPI003799B9D8